MGCVGTACGHLAGRTFEFSVDSPVEVHINGLLQQI
jgi:hypothetical protein